MSTHLVPLTSRRTPTPRPWRGPTATLVALLAAVMATASSAAAAPERAAAEPAGPQPYQRVELQARTNLLVNDDGFNLPPGSSFNSVTAAINERDEVAFPVQLVYDVDKQVSHPGVWFGSRGQGRIVTRGKKDGRISPDLSLNDRRQIAFTFAGDSTDNLLYQYDVDTAGVARQRFSRPIVPNHYAWPQINATGAIGVRAGFNSGSSLLMVAPDDTATTIAGTKPVTGDPYHYVYTPAFNDRGQVAVKVGTSAESYDPVEIRLFDADGTSRPVLANVAHDPSSAYASFDNSVSVNDAGQVAVVATRASDRAKVLVVSDGTTTVERVVAGKDRPIRSFAAFAPDVNDHGAVVFRGVDAQGEAVYVSRADGTLVLVAHAGQQVETDQGAAQIGQHDASTVFGGAPKINDRGSVVFTAALHPLGDPSTEWGSGMYVAYEEGPREPAGELQVEGGPLSVSPEGLYGSATRTVTLTNTGDASLRWEAAEQAAWLSLPQSSGELAPGASASVRVVATRAAVRTGRHEAAITFTSGGVERTVPVSFAARRVDLAVDVAGRGRGAWMRDRSHDGATWGRTGTSRVARTSRRVRAVDGVLLKDQRTGRVTYRFDRVPAGAYRVRVGVANHPATRPPRVVRVLVGGRVVIAKLRVPEVRGGAPRGVWGTATFRHTGGRVVVTVRGVKGPGALGALRLTER